MSYTVSKVLMKRTQSKTDKVLEIPTKKKNRRKSYSRKKRTKAAQKQRCKAISSTNFIINLSNCL